MQEVTCFHCRTVVEIAPDNDHCTNCGEDLRGLLAPEHISDYFCARAGALASSGKSEDALAEAERGLTYHDLPELRLLAAILAEEQGLYDLMRAHVAAIPVDDSLRPEAEWLLRAHQDRQRALREGAKQVRYGGHPATGSTVLAEVLGVQSPAVQPRRRGLQIWTGVATTLIVVLLSVTWLASRQGSGGMAEQTDAPRPALNGQAGSVDDQDVDALAPESPEVVGDDNRPGVETNPAADGTGQEQNQADQVEPADGMSPEESPASPEPEQPAPTQPVPEDLVLPATETEAIVDSNPRSVVVLNADEFDLDRYLRESGYPELAKLPVDARLQEDRLILTGIVYLDLQRRQILEALAGVSGIEEITAVDLLLRPKQTYVVQEGDTLWNIVYNIYGNVDRVEEFFLANIDKAPSPDALRVGDELRVPPIE